MNGLPAVRFSANDSNFLAFARPVQDDFTILCVLQSSQGLGTGTLFWQGAGLVNAEMNGPTNDFGTSLNAAGQILAGTGNPIVPDNTAASSAGFNNGAPHVFSFTRSHSTGALALYVDGTLSGTATGTTNSLTTPSRVVLGAQQTLTNFFSGDITEVQIFGSALLATDRQSAERALAIKYGIHGSYGSNVPPVITVNSPTNNSIFVQPKTLTLSASASDLDGTIARVDFLSGTNLLGSITNPPDSLTWSNVAPGKYTLWGCATDNLGATNSSPAVAIVVRPLTLVVLPPTNGQFSLQFQGQNNQNYILDTSTNLALWVPVLTNVASNGLFLFRNTNPADPKRFYRVQQ
jgi:hypothetical protein